MKHLAWPVFVLAGLLACGNSAFAQQEQWLQYRTSADVYQSIGSSSGQMLSPQDQPPEGVALPKFISDKPVFMKWQPKVDQAVLDKAKGGVWMALDRSRKNGPYDRLYIDSNLDGSLADETPIKAAAYQESDFPSEVFKLVKVTLPGIDGPTAYHLEILYQEYSNPPQPPSSQPGAMRRSARATAAGWYEGEITVDGKKHWCMLMDNNANGCFNDTGDDRAKCDVIRIGAKNDRKFIEDSQNDFTCRAVGQLIEIDGKLHSLKVASDGASVTIGPPTLPIGGIRVPANISYLSVLGPQGQFVCQPRDGLAAVPAGTYKVDRYEVVATDSAGVKWQIREGRAGYEKPFAVAEGKEYALGIGEPFKAELNVSSTAAGQYSINQSLRSRNGDYVSLFRDGRQADTPKVHIKNADGSYDKTFTMEFG